jgi:hypothetical protein
MTGQPSCHQFFEQSLGTLVLDDTARGVRHSNREHMQYLLSGEAALAVALNASLSGTRQAATEPEVKPRTAPNTRRSQKVGR